MVNKFTVPTLLLAVLLFMSCAHQMAPGGGPDDKTGPVLLSANPSPGSVNVGEKPQIVFTFSEWISTGSDKSVSIFPPVKFKSKVSRNKLLIEPLSKLNESTTYHLIITTALKDLHNNPLPTPNNFVFSTGNTLDSGIVKGCVIDPSRKSLQPRIALFTPGQIADSGITSSPSYLLQTDSTGHFDFNNLKTGLYKILGYIDANSDSRLQSGTEQVFIPVDSIINVLNEPFSITLFPASFDTSFPIITTIKATSEKVISGKWDKIYDSLVFTSPGFHIENTDDSIKSDDLQYIVFNNSTEFAIVLKKSMGISQYKLIYNRSKVFNASSISDTILFNGTNAKDTSFPYLKSSSPANAANLKQDIKLIWSEPVWLGDSIPITNQTGDSVWMVKKAGFSDTALFTPVKKLQPGQTYQILIPPSFGKDITGNPLKSKDTTGDTTALITVKTIDPDSLAYSLSGGAPCLKQARNLIWFFSHFNKKDVYHSPNDTGIFTFDSIRAGKGNVGYFVDRNNNSLPDKGRVLPWIAPEPYVISPDTVEARVGWDIEGINIPVCDFCAQE